MRLVCGFGYNDIKETGPQSKFYTTWHSMIKRCYSSEVQKLQPTYVGCSVCEDWLTFSKFKAWMEKQDWEGKCLDKDLLFPGNKVYSPETCVFISQELNKFLTEKRKSNGIYPIGVNYDKNSKKFKSQCQGYLGLFETPEKAHEAWAQRKLEIARMHASKENDPKIAEAVIKRYMNYSL